MLRCVLLVAVVLIAGNIAQSPPKCVAPTQFAARIAQYNFGTAISNRFIVQYDAVNERIVMFEEMNAFSPGKRFYEYLILAKEGVEYKYDQRSHECTKAPARAWRPFEVPNNATFEGEFTLGGPGEMFTAQQWSDRISLRQNAMTISMFSLVNCFPIKEVLISNDNVSDTVSTDFYDMVEGNPNPNDFLPPRECLQTKNTQNKPFTLWP